MYYKIEGGDIVDIQGLFCNIPPVGYVYNRITHKLDYVGTYRRSDDNAECFWEVPQFPSWYKDVIKKWDNYDKAKKDDDEDFYDEKLERFKAQEWHRRLNGFWFQNNDKPTYITGLHYYYLCYWYIDIGLPKFRLPDLEKSYFLQYCVEDPLCMGMTEVTKRRFGKSYFAGAYLTEAITRTKMSFGGIQSKTGNDAKKFFAKTIVNPFRRLPKYFRPIYDTSLGQTPKSELRFQRPNVRGKKSEENVADDELGGCIDWASADTMAYDGQKLFAVVQDECYKTTEANIYDRHEVIRYCLLDDEGNIIGKAIYTSTVEKLDSEKDGVQEAGKLLWDESNQLDKGENGRTKSGLYRFFMSAKKTRNFDPYGFPDEEKTEKIILSDRETVKNNPRALSARIRKEPLTIEEAFSIDADGCVFNVANIAERKKQLIEKPIFKRKVIYYRDLDQHVKWRDANNSDGDFYWKHTHMASNELANQYKVIDKLRTPININKYSIVIDSYSNSQGGRKYGSKACAWIGRKYDVLDSENTGKPTGILYGRPQVKEKLHEQVMLCAEFHGCKVWYEFTSDDYLSYFRERGRIRYLGRFPLSAIDPKDREKAERHFGFPITPFSLTKQLDMGISYFENYCYKIDFEELFPHAEKFDPYNRTAFDMVVSFMMLIVVLFEAEPTQIKRQPLIATYN
jgi:hypothetical protein